jgi:hypothetical protein
MTTILEIIGAVVVLDILIVVALRTAVPTRERKERDAR